MLAREVSGYRSQLFVRIQSHSSSRHCKPESVAELRRRNARFCSIFGRYLPLDSMGSNGSICAGRASQSGGQPVSANSAHWVTGAESTTIWQTFRNTGAWRAACPLMSAERRATRRMRHCSSSNGNIFRLRSITRPSCISCRWRRPASSTSEPVSEPTLLRLRRWGIRS